jgi:hypothetical protein
MENRSAENKKSLIAIGALMLSLAALQSPLWRSQAMSAPITVRSGGATLISSDRPIAQVVLDHAGQATAEVVGDHEVLIRGKVLGETQLKIDAKDGHSRTYRIVVESESAAFSSGPVVSR